MKSSNHFLLALFFTGFFIAAIAGNTQEYQKASEYLDKKGEVYFKCTISNRAVIDTLTKIVSIDNVKGLEVFAYANKIEFSNFLNLRITYTILPHPGDQVINPKMLNYGETKEKAWDAYPTYESYIAIMQQFAHDYPQLCQIVETGTTVQGRKLLFAKISDNVATDETEPHFMYSSSMHGDETVGYGMLLHLIDYLLSNYGTDSEVTNLVNSLEIWISPLANPDGTYASGNSTVQGATRYNGNSIDLNRNYPNPVLGEHPDGSQWQPETQAMMTLSNAHNFTMSANFHGGAEVLNYPWDSWTSTNRLTADDAWWQFVSREYADTVHGHSVSGYMTDENNGITYGGDWYIAYGTRQDYLNYYQHCKEVTIELSNTKLVPPADLPLYWNYNYRSLLQFMHRCTAGIRGIVTDKITGNPIRALIHMNHDRDNSEVYSSVLLGDFYRPVAAGTYTMTVSRDGYKPATIQGIAVTNGAQVISNVILEPITTSNKIVLSGTILTQQGTPVGSNAPVTYDVSVRLFDNRTGETPKYTEQFLIADTLGITINKGNIIIPLGNGLSNDNLQSVIQQNNNLWAEITVDGDLLSRVPLTATPFVLGR